MTKQDENNYEISPIELFFDLVFVFGVSQLSKLLLNNLSWSGIAQTIVALTTILSVWTHTSWAVTMVRIDRLTTKWMVFAVMLLGFFMNAAIPSSFVAGGWVFITTYLSIQIGRTIWTIFSTADEVLRNQYTRVLIWLLLLSPLWIAGAFLANEARLYCWLIAGSIDIIGTWLAHPVPGRKLHSDNIFFDAEHFLERCRLFLLIALGETVLAIGNAVSDKSFNTTTMLSGTFALLGTAALGSLCLGRVQGLIDKHIEETNNPIKASRYGGNILIIMVGGLIAIAVANEKIISHPTSNTELGLSALLCGGPALFLLAQSWYFWKVLNQIARLHILSGSVLVIFSFTANFLPSNISLILVGLFLSLVAVIDMRKN